ncbi:MAG: electron transfer flavoprotein subunit alpha/FixB family protein [Bacteroidia bacterium]|nr:electron transfer flavoprotein subunit alpha/FixB family protein [Bacteroidia bacterium]
MAILVFAENIDGIYKKSSFEAVSYATAIASATGDKVIAASLGTVEGGRLEELARYGADKIVNAADKKLDAFNPQAYASVLAQIAKQENAAIVVLSNTYSGKSLAPRLAVKLNAGLVSGVITLPETSSGFKVKKTVFSGKAFADVEIKNEVKILALTANSYSPQELNKTAEMAEFSPSFSDADFASQSVEVKRVSGKIPLTEAELVVSGGRGMKGPENWAMLEELANVLGAATACSKPVSDMHWRPHSEHVGQTGITIKPNLYIACGISGAIQHLAGVSSSKVIVAINKDPEAPFFKAADYGIIGDVFDVVPKLVTAAKNLKSSQN